MAIGTWDAIIVGGGPAGPGAALVLGCCLRRVLAIDAGRQALRRRGNGIEALRLVEALARSYRHFAIDDAHLCAVAIQLEFVRPAGFVRRARPFREAAVG